MTTVLLWMFESVFGCHHQKISRVFTIRKHTYQVCLDCGREFPYSWELMRSIGPAIVDTKLTPLNGARPLMPRFDRHSYSTVT